MIVGKVVETIRYELFELHEFNRDVVRDKRFEGLKASLERWGWWLAEPMYVIDTGRGRLKIKDGHRRFVAARELGIPVRYIVVKESNGGPSVVEMQDKTLPWSLKDYLTGYCRQMLPEYLKVRNYHERTGISLSSCLSMLGGQTAGTNNLNQAFKRGTYQSKGSHHAEIVADIVLQMKNSGISWATNNLLVQAISRVAWVDGFDPDRMKYKIATYPFLVERQANLAGYLEMLEAVYNRQTKEKIPLVFLADEVARRRNPTLIR